MDKIEKIEEKIEDEFVSHEHRRFKWHLGKVLASSLSGFIVGAIVMIIIFLSFFNLTFK
jgi:Fe2+ transport system protein B